MSQSIASAYMTFAQKGAFIDAIHELYAEDIVSVEPMAFPGMERVTTGRQAVIDAHAAWGENHEVHGAKVEGPWPHADEKFAVRFEFDVTNKPSGQRSTMDEIAVFTVNEGKISRVEFFFGAP